MVSISKNQPPGAPMKRASILAAALILPLVVASCARLDNWSDAFSMDRPDAREPVAAVRDTPEMAAMPQSDDPDVAVLMARMGQLEQEIAEVRIEMSRILPAIEQLNATVQRNEGSRPVNLRPSIANSETAAMVEENRFAVHLASYRNRQGAIEGWDELRMRFGPVLNSLEPRVAAVEIEGRGTFYRLKAGPFTNWGSANETCDYLRGESWSCAVMDFSGEAPE